MSSSPNEPNRMIPEDIQDELNHLREWMLRFVMDYSQGVPWSHMISMLGSVTSEADRLLQRAGEVDLRARIPLTTERKAEIEAEFEVPDAPPEEMP